MYRLLADSLSACRLLAAVGLIWLGTRGPDTLPATTLLIIAAWTSDQLDGWAARRAATATRLAHLDFPIDISVYIGMLLYLGLSGYVLPEIIASYVLIVLALAAVFRRKAIVVLSLRLIDATCGWILFRYDWRLFVGVVLWLAVMAFVYRRRLRERVPRWLRELREMAGAMIHR